MDDRDELRPYEPDPTVGYEYEYDDEPAPQRILWGRIVALAVALLLAFLLGRALAPEGISPEELTEARAEAAELREENAALQQELDEAQAAETPVVAETPVDDGTVEEEPAVEGPTYVVQSGETLRIIAERLCGDPEFDEEIMSLNGISDPTLLRTGQELVLPEECDA